MPRLMRPSAGAPADGLYFMSNEAPTANSVLTDDFRRGSWYTVDADHTAWRTTAPGWGGSIFYNPITPSGAAIDLNAIGKNPLFATSNWAATSGVLVTTDHSARNDAAHNLSGAGSGGYNEIYCRCYKFYVPANYYGTGNPSADYVYGAQKVFTVNRFDDGAGIYWATFQWNMAAGSTSSSGAMKVDPQHGVTSAMAQNQGNNISVVAGSWYYIEFHMKLNTNGNTDGVYDLWINNGGPTGDFSGQSPILRAHRTDVDWGYSNTETQLIGNIWFENWSNPGSSGEEFTKNIHVATTGPIGLLP
jgi:hypothetical protein